MKCIDQCYCSVHPSKVRPCPKTARKFFRSCARPFSVCFILGWSCCKMLEKEQSSNNLLGDLNITNKYLHLPVTKLSFANYIVKFKCQKFLIFMVRKHLYQKQDRIWILLHCSNKLRPRRGNRLQQIRVILGSGLLSVDVGQEGLIQMLMVTFVPQRRRSLHSLVPPALQWRTSY